MSKKLQLQTIAHSSEQFSQSASKKSNYNDWSKEQLITEVARLRKRKKYGLVWEEKPEDVVEQCKTELPVLKEVKNKAITKDTNAPTNILIEGDNFHALSVLNYTHKGKIDVIYIDPPYNTGAKDWKYNNDFVDINDGYRHSKWLSFMRNRLMLAKKLLSQRGVLICTIDHNEQAALGLLLEEIFPDREKTCVTIIHNPSGIQGKNFSHNNEYAFFVYRPDKKAIDFEERSDEDADVRQFMNTAKGRSTNYLRESGPNCFYPIYVKNLKIIGFGQICQKSFHPKSSNIGRSGGIVEVYPIDSNGVERKWVFARQSVEPIKDELSAKYNPKTKTITIIRTKKKINYKTVWAGEKFNAKTYGTQLLHNILGREFPFPKSLYAVMECVNAVVHDKDNSIILDFFAGSGTTGHAVLKLNNQDNGARKFILCTNNEDNNGDGFKIADDICYPRIEKVINDYMGRDDKKRYKGLGGNLKYFRTAFVGAEPNDKNKEILTRQATEMLCMREDTFEPVKDTELVKMFKSGKRYTGIVFDEDVIPALKKDIAKIGSVWSVYIFSLGDETFDEEFEDMKQKITVAPIPEAILRVYRRLFKI